MYTFYFHPISQVATTLGEEHKTGQEEIPPSESRYSSRAVTLLLLVYTGTAEMNPTRKSE